MSNSASAVTTGNGTPQQHDTQPQLRYTFQQWDQQRRQLPEHADPERVRFQEIKTRIHQQLVESLDLSAVRPEDQPYLLQQMRQLVQQAVAQGRWELLPEQRNRMAEELMDELFGLGPLEPLMRDPEITDILVNDPYTVYVERRGRLELTDVVFADQEHLWRLIQRIVARLGRRIDEASPMVDARLPDGSRVNAVVPPLALGGPCLSIRRFGFRPLEIEDLLAGGSLPQQVVRFLAAAIQARVSMVISGGTGAGKTTLLNALSRYIPAEERIITIEDSAELILRNRHWVRLETRLPNIEGQGEVTQRDLVRNSLRMRPDRIIVGEVRGPEVWDMLQAMNTGHEGSLTTVHANSAPDALIRLEMMIQLAGSHIPIEVIRQYIASGIQLVVHLARLKGGRRRLMQVVEIQSAEKGQYRLVPLFGFRQTGVDARGGATGHFFATGQEPQCAQRIAEMGVELPPDLFAACERLEPSAS